MCTGAEIKAALDKLFYYLNLFQFQQVQVHGTCCAPGRDALCVGKRLKHLIFPGNKMVVVKKKECFCPEQDLSGMFQVLNAPLQLGLLEG